jgi:hypothetical protein
MSHGLTDTDTLLSARSITPWHGLGAGAEAPPPQPRRRAAQVRPRLDEALAPGQRMSISVLTSWTLLRSPETYNDTPPSVAPYTT